MSVLKYLLTHPFSAPGLGIACVLILSGCTTMSEGECLTADWYEQGYRDGRQGYPASRVINHRDSFHPSVATAISMLI